MGQQYRIIIELDDTDPPKPHEKRAAKFVAEYFKSDLKFIRTGIGRSPDFVVVKTSESWELKSPIGDSRQTIANNLRDASDQSKKVFLDLSRCKMHTNRAISRARDFAKGKWCHLKKLKIITKTGQIVDII